MADVKNLDTNTAAPAPAAMRHVPGILHPAPLVFESHVAQITDIHVLTGHRIDKT